MDNFIVSARKYRPQNFSTVVGQSHITRTLKNAILHNQIAHAFLFCGPRGVGKTTCARILAKTINCENRQPDGEACNTCNSCTSFARGTSLNIHELDAASNNSVEDIRSLTEQVRFAPQAGRYKVYIIDEVHMLTKDAFNAFLKTLEEPPPYAIFILATTEKHKILPTILSRCQIFDFRRITDGDTVEHLEEIAAKEGIRAEKAALQVIAQKSEGCLRDALSILDKIVSFTDGELTYANTLEHLNILDEDYFFRFLEHMRKEDMASVMLLFDEINRKGFDGELMLNALSEFLRNLMVCKDPRTLPLLQVVESFRDRYAAAAAQCSMAWLIGAANVLNEAEMGFRTARNKRLHVEMALIRLTYLHQAMEWSDNGAAPAQKRSIEGMKAVRFRRLPPMEFKQAGNTTAQAKLVIEQGATAPAATHKTEAPPTVRKPAAPMAPTATEAEKPRPGLGALNKIRRQIRQKGSESGEGSQLLEAAAMAESWDAFIAQLTEEKDHSTASNLKAARWEITDGQSFDIHVGNNLQMRFVEQLRSRLLDHVQRSFRNRGITFRVLLQEEPEPEQTGEKPLSKREQYQILSEKYPLLRTLKESLGLDLE